MDPHSYPLLGDVVPSSDETEKLEASGSESKLTLDYSDWEAYVGRPFNIKPSYLSSVHALSVVLISLAVTYFLLRCFELTKVRNRVAPLTRVLAAGDGRPCQESGEDEELGKNEERDDFWFDGLDRSARKPPAQDDFSEGSSRMSGDMQRLPAISTVASPAGFVGTGGLASGTRGLASGVGWTTSVESTAEPLEYQTSLERNESVLQYPQPRGTLQPCSEQLECASDNGEQTRAKVQLREGETLEMWEMRKLPPFVETQLVGVFNRTIEAVTACRSLLPRLGGEQLLQLPCEVMRLLALELGALSLVRENIEPLRSELGQAIVDLGIDALQRSNALHGCQNITRHREEIRQLIALVLELKDPRPMTEYNCADKYRIKMISLLQTAPLTVGYCLGALEALQAYTHDGRSAPLPMVDNQIALLKALYATHSAQIAKDPTLRYFIITSQKRLDLYPIFSAQHHQMNTQGLPKLNVMIEEIHQAVASAGGISLTSGTPSTKCDVPAPSQEQTPQHVSSPHEPTNGTPTDKQQHFRTEAVAEPQYLQATAPFVQPLYPRFVPSRIGHHAPQHHLPQRLPMPLLHHRFSSQVSGMHRQEPTMRVIPSQVSSSLTAQIGPLDGPTLPKPIYASGGGGGTSLPMPYSVWWEESMTPPQPHPQHTRPEITETTVPRGVRRYSSHRHYSSYDRRALRPVGGLPTVEQGAWQASGGASGGNYEAVRADTQQQQLEAEELEEEGGLFADMGGFPTVEESTWQASGGAYGRNSESVQADAQQQQLEAEELEEEEGMLADLLKGGLKIKDIFPNGKPPYK